MQYKLLGIHAANYHLLNSPALGKWYKKNATLLFGRLRSDPSEHVDLARTEAGVYESLLARFKELEDGYHPPKANPPMDTQGVCDAIRANGGFLRPWK